MTEHALQADRLYNKALDLLKKLISTPSFSGEEDETAALIAAFFKAEGIVAERFNNNLLVRNLRFEPEKPTILLNSHHDTVRPNPGYTLDPFVPVELEGRLHGLGSNDAGGALVSLMAAFLHYYPRESLRYNLIFTATAEEENSGTNGVEMLLPEIGEIAFAVVGEPTLMELSVAEKGLFVIDCIARGKAGHAAREEGINAIYEALPDIEWFRTYQFPRISPVLGPVKMTVTIVEAGSQHNVVPATCKFTVDVRVTDAYTFEEVLETISRHVRCEFTPRSLRLRPSSIPRDHPFVQAALQAGKKLYGSPTSSDQALIPFPSVKIGPGDSARSHTANEFIYLREIRNGIEDYIRIFDQILL